MTEFIKLAQSDYDKENLKLNIDKYSKIFFDSYLSNIKNKLDIVEAKNINHDSNKVLSLKKSKK